MNKIILLVVTMFLSCGAFANVSCSKLSNLADNNYKELDALELLQVAKNLNPRVYFHSAPSEKCKISQLFIIPSDVALAYYLFRNEDQDWVYITYTGKDNKKTAGWVQRKYFNFLKTVALDN